MFWTGGADPPEGLGESLDEAAFVAAPVLVTGETEADARLGSARDRGSHEPPVSIAAADDVVDR